MHHIHAEGMQVRLVKHIDSRLLQGFVRVAKLNGVLGDVESKEVKVGAVEFVEP